jgi:putative ABC transport system permease protein
MCLFQTGSAEYFRAMGIPLLAGRSFDTRDTATSSPVVVVDETLVRRFFSGRNPIGKRVAFEFRGETREDPKPVLREIVGVVGYVHHYGLSSGPSYLQVYTPYAQLPIWFERRRPSLALFARTTADPQLVVGSIRREMKAIDPDIPVYGVQPMATYVSQTIEQPRLGMMLLASFAALALVLAVVGIYGVVSYLVGQRTREIGVRIALGASRGDVLRMILGEGLVPIGIGVALGVGASLVLARLISDQLYQVSPHDPATFAVIAASLTIVGVAAHYVPARSATRVDPLVALRTE